MNSFYQRTDEKVKKIMQWLHQAIPVYSASFFCIYSIATSIYKYIISNNSNESLQPILPGT